ncbi:hypothetical protein BS50DRAFT_651821 [Corynespora cassiicola Philippines]|uniref:Ent-kaurene synthase n=1 Tax=Corynespora cassiicola Philippines TaxID=1448308 RepID=A0A2T2N806_CORCC|nr:hypothetical protein BS50DRAFT_651821 [Corynespora cassiicola Philippines]
MALLKDVHEEAAKLVADMASRLDDKWYPSSMSTNVYDTAWVSMVSKEEDWRIKWLLPKAFEFILSNQHANGHWDDEEPRANAILSTMAATLACFEHERFSHYVGHVLKLEDVRQRTSKAVTWLRNELTHWNDQNEVDSVALEILVPALLDQLAKHGVSINSPYLAKMSELSESHLSKAKMVLYSGKQITLFHSLEALIGRIEFDKLGGCKVRGSMLGSPSSTAAYLMELEDWDMETEDYLRYVFEHGEGKGNGSFPSAAPIDVFEISWTISTLLECGIPIDVLGKEHVTKLASHLAKTLDASGGVVGFSLGMLPDADDTAKTLHALSFLGKFDADVSTLVTRFRSPGSFKTYEKESTRSLSANCNVLKALLATKNPDSSSAHILTAASFICHSFMSGKARDKWNTAWEYCAMLSVQSLVPLLQQSVAFLPYHIRSVKIPIVLAHITCRLLNTQEHGGSFGNQSDEITAYATLALIALAAPQTGLNLIEEDISSAIERAREFLSARLNRWESRRNWVEKVTYSSSLLTKTYCFAALDQALRFQPGTRGSSSPAHWMNRKLSGLLKSTKLFVTTDGVDTLLRLAMQESVSHVAHLEHTRFDIFPQPVKVNEKYLNMIPFAWTACNYLSGCPLSPNVLIDMMEISMLNYQADEFVELQIPLCKEDQVFEVRNALNEQLVEHADKNAEKEVSQRSHIEASEMILQTFAKYIDRILNHPHIQNAPLDRRLLVRQELIGYLQAQISTIGAKEKLGTKSSFFDWIHTFGARDTSCPFSFAYYLCIVNFADSNSSKSPNKHQSITCEAEYLLRDLCGSLSRLCRIYNDYGSIHRDREEGNLNSIDFFMRGLEDPSSGKLPGLEAQAKCALWSMADYERQHMTRTFELLRNMLGPRLHGDMQVFLNVTDLFGQIYVVQDIGTRTKDS